jgi:23S rRNA A2030 N6-methylase RlmJ
MANTHYAEIGDIWKHLPLAEILAIERPRRYWESHAGSACYPLTPSLGRDYGAGYFVQRAPDAPTLRDSAFWSVLRPLAYNAGLYPGSPLIAMSLLGAGVDSYLFCDTDAASLHTIQDSSRQLGLPADRLRCVQGDGVGTLYQTAAQLPGALALEAFAHIDPYRPFEQTAAGLTSLELFGELSARGVKAMLWYGYDSPATRSRCEDQLRSGLAALRPNPSSLWCGEINLAAMHDPGFTVNPGVQGCGVLLSNVSARTMAACTRLGEALAEIYRSAIFPDGRSGALDFAVVGR